ncbi:nuclease [Sphingobium sp. HBC34]|uniref:Nuclease n=1 Tax=Sphingobium cyanobacteriorum TaxID=3063954 RepID=A0ABT8ZIX4_9SPHN|nr:nuclease [Sphingobium sp. HBC34]MDO7834484.1 nuclease [Sphingobium sp. HBC34]
MARNLYDVGDRPDETGAWLNDKQEERARVVPVGMILAALALAAGVMFLLKDALPGAGQRGGADGPATISATFALCDDPGGDACVLSADTYAWRGRRYHLSDLSVPSLTAPLCEREGARARQGRAALATMMNGGAFEAVPDPTDPDPASRILTRDGVSLSQLMILKGHARPWSRTAIDWCAD